jgi:hypothetical protein
MLPLGSFRLYTLLMVAPFPFPFQAVIIDKRILDYAARRLFPAFYPIHKPTRKADADCLAPLGFRLYRSGNTGRAACTLAPATPA